MQDRKTEAASFVEEMVAIFDAVPGMALISRDKGCHQMTGNRTAYDLLRLPYGANISKSAREEEIPRSFRVTKEGRSLSSDELPMQMAAASGRPVRNSEITVVFEDGTSLELLGNASPLLDENGEVRGAIGVFIDVTERKRAEQSLRAAQAELVHVNRVLIMGELVTSIAHEVNQPLTGILATSGCILREMEARRMNFQAIHEAITEIAEDATRINDIILRTRALVKKECPEWSELNINHVIRDAALFTNHEAARTDVHVRLDLAFDLPRVLGDRVQLQQVLINLAMNGIDSMRTIVGRPRELVFKSTKCANGVLVQVQDSGTGLNADAIDRIFEPFFSTKSQGIGMGLSISRSIIESHGGLLWAEPGSYGSVFQITLPANRDEGALYCA